VQRIYVQRGAYDDFVGRFVDKVQRLKVGDPAEVSPDAGAVLAMTLREAVTNVIRHAGATSCTIEVASTDGGARLTVADNGKGGSFREGNGLTGMRQRLAAAGGTLSVRSDGGGTQLVAGLPA